ncbi:hypothetical protein C8Q80DRAFT_146989 [Daedaleopsis nitida]|nr:hypothetical protein C8Q80DRAFT_146989 [Daedaleopsis nitida]
MRNYAVVLMLTFFTLLQAGAVPKSAKTKGKQKPKKSGKKKSGRNSTSFTEFFFRLFLLWFTIYTLSVCPQDEQLKSPVCRGLAEYRRLVIDPYITPSIQQALAHPSVAPYVKKVQPYADYAVRTAKPIAARAQKEFDTRVVPQWKKRVVPMYYKYAVPQLVKLDAQTAPYRTRAEHEYERTLAPYLHRTIVTLNQWQYKARPYVILAANKTYQGYQYVRPYARPLWTKVKAVLAQLAVVLGEQRRQFVDPHVKKIWEHVKEMSNGNPQKPPIRSSASSKLSQASSQLSNVSAKVSSTLSSVASSVTSKSSAISSSIVSKVSEAVSSSGVPPPAQTTESVKSSGAIVADNMPSAVSSASDTLESTASIVSSSASTLVSSVLSVVPSSASSLMSVASSVADGAKGSASPAFEAASSPMATLAESASAAASGAAQYVSSVGHTSADIIPSSAADVASLAVAEPPASIPETTSEVVDDFADPDLDIFKLELGLTDDFLEGKEVPEVPEEHEETEEERAERERQRLEKVAQERAALHIRHTEWERKVEALVEESKETLRRNLGTLRKAAVAELKANVAIQKEVDGLVQDAEKFLRGAEKYLTNLQKENRKPEEKKTVWDRVIGKLEDKFSDRLRQTEVVVNGWYNGAVEKEAQEVNQLTDAVKDLAERAQTDIGLDYAYLDDVSYHDWQRYHDLIRRSENFTVYAQNVQEGSHQSSPVNPVIPAIQELQEEVEDVIKGFNARLRQIKRSGVRSFGLPDEEVDDEDETASILPIEDPQQTESPADTAADTIPPVVIGRGKVEVEAAMNRVADLEGQKTSSPDEPEKVKDANAVAQSLKDAVASEETSSSSSLHEEL